MDTTPTDKNRVSSIPRPSRIPSRLPRPSTSLQQPQPQPQQSLRLPPLANPRLRPGPAIPLLPSSTTSKATYVPRRNVSNSNSSSATVIHTPLQRKASSQKLYAGQRRLDQAHAAPNLGGDESILHDDNGLYTPVFLEGEETARTLTPRKSRPSLTERAMETLKHIPSSPAVGNRRTSFFRSESPAHSGTSSRPGSSYQNDGSMPPPSRSFSSRPSSSSGPASSLSLDLRASTNTFKPPQPAFQPGTPLKQGTSRSLKTPSRTPSALRLPSPSYGSSTQARSPSPTKKSPMVMPGSQTIGRTLKPRASVGSLFRKPSMPDMRVDHSAAIAESSSSEYEAASTTTQLSTGIAAVIPSSPASFVASKKAPVLKKAFAPASKISKPTALTASTEGEPVKAVTKTSNALRDQIAKAKAAAKAAAASPPQSTLVREVPVSDQPAVALDFDVNDNPFNLPVDEIDGLLQRRINAARGDGRLNIAGMGLKAIPQEVMSMYELTANASWAEAVDLNRFNAADNEIEFIDDTVFPDIDFRDVDDDDDEYKGNQFGGLETLDLRNNTLSLLPIGLRRLELLTTLNMTNNKLTNECFNVVSQIPSLRILSIAGNGLSGILDGSIAKLENLEVLDIQRNLFNAFPPGISSLKKLRILNCSENKFASLPFEVLRYLPLTEILAVKNVLAGSLITAEVEELPNLQILDVACNSLTCLTTGQISLPALHQFNCSMNRINQLPDMSTWSSLLMLAARDNLLAKVPDGFVELSKVKNVDFGGNNITVIDDRIGAMEGLDAFRIAANPLREKKFLNMSTDDLKRALKARLAPLPQSDDDDDDPTAENAVAFFSASSSPSGQPTPSAIWPVNSGFILDRSNTKSYSLNPIIAAEVAAANTIRVLELHHNTFKEIPNAVTFFATNLTTLNLSHNELTHDTYMKDDFQLPALKELTLSCNTFTCLRPLMERLQAPNLETLDISFNRLTSLPILRSSFPKLTTVLASNNKIRELSPDSVKGLRVLDCASNEINSLAAHIGLIEGIQRLDVSGNLFRVPNYTILGKGTEATLAWLRNRVPADEANRVESD